MRIDIAFEDVAGLADATNLFPNDAGVPAVGLPGPAEGLAAFERGGEIEISDGKGFAHIDGGTNVRLLLQFSRLLQKFKADIISKIEVGAGFEFGQQFAQGRD